MTIKALIELNKDYVNLLKENLPLALKYRIQKWINANAYILDDVLKKRSDIILSINDSGVIKNNLEDGTVNPEQTKFAEEFNKILLTEIDTPIPVSITMEDLEGIKTTQHFPAIFSQPEFHIEDVKAN